MVQHKDPFIDKPNLKDDVSPSNRIEPSAEAEKKNILETAVVPKIPSQAEYYLEQGPLTGGSLNAISGATRIKRQVQAQIEHEARQAGMKPDEYKKMLYEGSPPLHALEQVVDSISAGVISLPKGIAEFAQAFTDSEAVKRMAQEMRVSQEHLLPYEPGVADHVLKTGGELATFFIPGVGVARGLRGFQIINQGMAAAGGALTSGVLESSRHAGEVYQELIDKGVSPEQAKENATKVFASDLVVTSLTNHFGVFGKGPVIQRLIKGGMFEGGQSAFQQGVHNKYTNRQMLEGMVQAALLGGLTGGALQGFQSGRLIQKFKNHNMLMGCQTVLRDLKFLNNDRYLERNYNRLAGDLGLSRKQRKAFKPQMEKDDLTGFGIAEDRIPTLQRAQVFADAKGVDSLYGEIDISNLGGMNLAKGRAGADNVFRDMAHTVRDEMQRVAKRCGGTVEFIRHGGDEFCVIPTGIPKKKFTEGLERAQKKIIALIEKEGLSDIPHPKHPNDPAKRGVGITFGVSKIDEVIEFRTSLGLADQQIEAAKLAGKTPGVDAPEAPTGRPPVDTTMPKPPTELGVLKSRGTVNAYLETLPQSVRNSGEFLSPDQVAAAVHNKKAKDLGLTDKQREALAPVVKRDPVTGQYTRFDRVEGLMRLINHAEKTGKPGVVVGYEVRNLAGLNKKLGATGANEGFAKLAQGLEQELKNIAGDNVSVMAYRNVGPRGEMQVAGASTEQVNQALEAFEQKISQMNKESGWDSISHPKDPHPSQQGVGLYTSVAEVAGDSNPATVYHSMNTGLREAEIARTSMGREDSLMAKAPE